MFRKLLAALFIAAFAVIPAAAQQSVTPVGGAAGGPWMAHYLSAANTNATLVAAGAHNVYQIIAINTTGTIYYLKFYDKALAPTCGTDTPSLTLPVPFGQSSSGGGFVIPMPTGSRFLAGVGFCLVGGIADNDNSNAATGIAINILAF